MSHRFDSRNKDQFKKEIHECTKIERVLMEEYVKWLNRKLSDKSYEYTFLDHGVDNSGEFIEKCQDVTMDADFLLRRRGKPDRKIDIKFCRPDRKYFHLKVSQLIQYVQDDVCIINFMAIESENPRFCILPPSSLSAWLDNGKRVQMWRKDCIRFPCDEMDWHYIS